MITELLGVVFPQLLGVRIEKVFAAGLSVRIQASTQDQDVPGFGLVPQPVTASPTALPCASCITLVRQRMAIG
ncbi:hypothetical protein SK854_45880 [Lentzea sp. BCCO 10_0061]|uniref:Uncharacterized protein n=1 Tax=Lentzea sokolovensis TaxID=3095429 RepID=A0ABU4VEV9_9PSEU|nr:hypothetical protein [Lentzea sp. BCCO 10_0061]MDX8149521.1 hypothetical protein [Lentzea sp. BCCO 10_0061]